VATGSVGAGPRFACPISDGGVITVSDETVCRAAAGTDGKIEASDAAAASEFTTPGPGALGGKERL
jgi:hypothetical protein